LPKADVHNKAVYFGDWKKGKDNKTWETSADKLRKRGTTWGGLGAMMSEEDIPTGTKMARDVPG
jgi:hypothetical protein